MPQSSEESDKQSKGLAKENGMGRMGTTHATGHEAEEDEAPSHEFQEPITKWC